MSDHLPECPQSKGCQCPWMPECDDCGCICDRLRACEQRVREEERALIAVEQTTLAELNAEYRKGLDSAREAVAGLPVIKEWWEAKGDYVHGIEDALAAIDALREEQK